MSKKPRHLRIFHLQDQRTTRAVTVRAESGRSSPGSVEIQQWNKKSRIVRSLIFFFTALILSLVSVLIPLLHFILVPGFLLAAPLGAWITFREESRILGGMSTCPDCNQPLPIVATSDRWPLHELCTQCQRTLWVEKE